MAKQQRKWWIWYLLDPIKYYCRRKLRRAHLAWLGFAMISVGLLGLITTVVLVGGELPLIETSRATRLMMVCLSTGIGTAGGVCVLAYLYKEARSQ